MVYLYAGLGVVMLSGIMAIFEMGLSLTGQSLLPMPVNTYRYPSSSEQTTERDLLMQSQGLPTGLGGMTICTTLETSYGPASGRFLPVPPYPSEWSNGCVLEYGQHQVLIAPSSDSSNPYLVLFCRPSDGDSLMCPFRR